MTHSYDKPFKQRSAQAFHSQDASSSRLQPSATEAPVRKLSSSAPSVGILKQCRTRDVLSQTVPAATQRYCLGLLAMLLALQNCVWGCRWPACAEILTVLLCEEASDFDSYNVPHACAPRSMTVRTLTYSGSAAPVPHKARHRTH